MNTSSIAGVTMTVRLQESDDPQGCWVKSTGEPALGLRNSFRITVV
jgi:hypothetical protein